jgi:GcrA cell cycle regulator
LDALGWSASLIGAELGVSRNAVIGKWNRLGIKHKVPPDGAERVVRQHRSYKRRRPTTKIWPSPIFKPVVVPRLRVVAPPAPVSLYPKGLLELKSGDCRFPISPDGSHDFLFCANPKAKGRSYCAGHYWIAHDHSGRKSQRVSLPSLRCPA